MSVREIDGEAEQARRFLLGSLSEDESAPFEERLLGEEELSEYVQAIESELFDSFVRDELSQEDRARFVVRFGGRRDEIAIARALVTRAARDVEKPVALPVWRWLAAAAMVVLVLGIAFLWHSTQQRIEVAASQSHPPAVVALPATDTASTTKTAPAIEPPEIVATLTIALASIRDDAPAPRLIVDGRATQVALHIRLNPADRFPAYDVELRRGNEVIHHDRLSVDGSSDASAATNELVATMPVMLFVGGRHYEVAVTGIRGDHSREELGYRTIEVDAHRSNP